MVADMHQSLLKMREVTDGESRDVSDARCPWYRRTSTNYHRLDSKQVSDLSHPGIRRLTFGSSVPGELPPLPPRVFFGRDDLIERIIDFTQQLNPIALIGAGGIGKTSIILTALHDDRIKKRFGKDRRFIRCDQFPASGTHFLRRLSNVIGAGIENPEDLSPLRPFLSSKEMVLVLDNAESILDPQGTNAREIYAIVDELSRFDNICLCITSRISTIPPGCESLEIPTLPMEAAHDTFYRIYKNSGQPDSINGILRQLDFHPLSITLLAITAQHNKWDADRLTTEWEGQRTGLLYAQHTGSLAATIELSLASPMFQELGPDARGLLEVVAFFPQGVNEKNVNWLFPTLPSGRNMFDKFCALSLTYRSNGYITMLAPLRDYLRPKDPLSSPLLVATKECYIARFSENIHPGHPEFEESRWIVSEDVNIEHLLDVFTSIDANSEGIWVACARFMHHLGLHKPRVVILGPKIEALPEDHPSKAGCLWRLSWLFDSLGNLVERKRLLTHALKIWREQGNTHWIAIAVSDLSDTNRQMGLFEEGIQQAKEAADIFEQLDKTANQAECLIDLAWLLWEDGQLNDAKEAVSQAIDLLPEKGEQRRVCLGHRVLGNIYGSKGETEKAVHHFEVALEAASSINLHVELFWVHYALAQLFYKANRLDDAHVHVECARSCAGNDPYLLARASQLQAEVWERQQRFEHAKSEILRVLDVFEHLGATNDAERASRLLDRVGRRLKDGSGSGPDESDNDGELFGTTTPLVVCIDFSRSDGITELE